MNLVHTWYVRGLVALLIVGHALSFLFATSLTLAYRSNYSGLTEWLGTFTPGGDYRRLIPLMNVTPWWLHTLWVAASVLFLVAAWLVLRNRRAALPVFAAALILGTAGNVISQALPSYEEVFAFLGPGIMRDYVIAGAVSLLVAAVLWQTARPRIPAHVKS